LEMKIAYLIAAHKNAGQVVRLIEQLDCEDAIFAIHIDKKSPFNVYGQVTSALNTRKNIIFIERIRVIYLGWGQCRVVFSALNRLCAKELQWDYFIHLSGQDYPIKPISYIHEWLDSHRGTNFIGARLIDTLEPRLRGTVRRRYQWLAIELLDRVFRLPIPLSPFNHLQIKYFGSAWYMITREFCNWVVESNAETEIARRFRYTASPDEFVMQDLIMTSPYRNTVECDNRRFYIFRDHNNRRLQHPLTLTLGHLEKIKQSRAFFARKFDQEVDDEVINAISQIIS